MPDNFFESNDTQCLSKHISRFIVETRKANGTLYPPSTLHSLMCGLLRHMRSINPGCPNFLDKKDHRFTALHKTLDSLFNKLHADGIGRNLKKNEILTVEDEKLLWESGVLNTSTPRGLLNAAHFTQLERCFALEVVRNTDF